MLNCVSQNEEFCIKNEEFGTKNVGFCRRQQGCAALGDVRDAFCRMARISPHPPDVRFSLYHLFQYFPTFFHSFLKIDFHFVFRLDGGEGMTDVISRAEIIDFQ